MKAVIKLSLTLAGIILYINPLHADGERWGNDITIYSGPISCFDVDYTMDGTMFLGFQKDEAPYYDVCFYTSTDYGYTWISQYESPSLGRIPKMKILVGEPVNNYLFFFFVSPIDEHPYVWRIASDFSGSASGHLIDDQIADEIGFDAARSIATNYILFFIYYSHSDSSVYTSRSQNFGGDWEYPNNNSQPFWARQDVSIAWGPPSNVYRATIGAAQWEPPDSGEIQVAVNESNAGGSWWNTSVTHNTRRDYDPHVAASHDPAHPAVWVAETYLDGGTDADLYVWSIDSLPYGSSANWTSTTISQTSVAEYWGDIEFYKEYGNPYVNMAWIYDDGGSNRNVHWAWSGGDNPAAWHDDQIVNDYLAHPWPYGAAPRIIYSPGAPSGGGGVVYAGYGGQNLYFDAPWITGVDENTSSQAFCFSVHPTMLARNCPINISILESGLVEMKLYNATGREVFHRDPVFWTEGSHSVQLDGVSEGIYFLVLKQNGHLSLTAKLVIIR